MWIKDLLTEIGSPQSVSRDYDNNMTAIHIAENIVFHERTEYIEVDCHIVKK